MIKTLSAFKVFGPEIKLLVGSFFPAEKHIFVISPGRGPCGPAGEQGDTGGAASPYRIRRARPAGGVDRPVLAPGRDPNGGDSSTLLWRPLFLRLLRDRRPIRGRESIHHPWSRRNGPRPWSDETREAARVPIDHPRTRYGLDTRIFSGRHLRPGRHGSLGACSFRG